MALLPALLPSDNSDLIACTVITKDSGQVQRFLAVDIYQMSLVEPDVGRLGWGVVKFAGLLQVSIKPGGAASVTAQMSACPGKWSLQPLYSKAFLGHWW